MEESKNYNLITTIMFISGIIVMASLYTALPLTATFAEDFHVPKSIATLNGVLFSLTYSISCLFYGTISEKYGRIKTILVGMSALVIICLMTVSYTHLTLPTTCTRCRSRWSPYQ